ncbi:MAG: hypothetical protein GY906_12220 [bacterium]|nr:hypothetical protein [bacterium]
MSSSANRSEERLAQISEAYERLQSWRAVARELGIPRSTVRHYQRKMGAAPLPIAGGDTVGMVARKLPLPPKGEVKRYILTCAQNNTHLHESTWANLIALTEHYEAQLFVSRFMYNKAAWAQKETKPGTRAEPEDLWYDPELSEFLCDERVQLAPNLVWCGESNIIPTAIRPLSGLESYTGRDSAIFPHVKIAMESVASGKHEGVKLLFTTGTVTLKNYIQRKAGLKAEFHHTYGALLVEVNHHGRWFCRQLNADSKTGDLYDLDLHVKDGELTTENRVEAITFGDIHNAQLDPETAELGWGRNERSMMNVLQPKKVFLHDLIDFRARNHHDRGNCHLQFEKFVKGGDDVQKELENAAELATDMLRQDAEVIVVQSNHDNALVKWLRESDYRQDPPNALIFLKCQARVYEAIARGEENFHLLEWILQQLNVPRDVRFLRTDESYIICKTKDQSGIQCGMHGHEGANGARGNPRAFSRMGRKCNIGHTHSACITDGVFVSGTSSNLDCGYNTGPSSWTHSHIITYPNGKRAIVTMYAGAWRAE